MSKPFCDVQSPFLRTYAAGTRWRMASSAATTAAACYLLCIILFAFVYIKITVDGNTEQIETFFGILFHMATFMGVLIVIVASMAIGFSLASQNVDCLRIAKDVNSIPIVKAALEECRVNPAACA